VQDENGDQHADSPNILNSWRNHISKVFIMHNSSDFRQKGVYKAGSLVPGPSRLELEMDIAKFKRYKSPSSDNILADQILSRSDIIFCDITNSLIL
jgi:hypothetical protein